MFDLASQGLSRLLQLQLLIARAGQRDSLQWWDDESLTSSGAYVVERVFVGAPQLTAQRLALRAAGSRHAAALADYYMATHLFHLDVKRQTELSLRGVRLPSRNKSDSHSHWSSHWGQITTMSANWNGFVKSNAFASNSNYLESNP